MLKIKRKEPKKLRKETDKDKIKRLEGEVSTLKVALDDLILKGMGGEM